MTWERVDVPAPGDRWNSPEGPEIEAFTRDGTAIFASDSLSSSAAMYPCKQDPPSGWWRETPDPEPQWQVMQSPLNPEAWFVFDAERAGPDASILRKANCQVALFKGRSDGGRIAADLAYLLEALYARPDADDLTFVVIHNDDARWWAECTFTGTFPHHQRIVEACRARVNQETDNG